MSDIEHFLDEQGRVNQWPSKQVAKELVLEYLASKFSMERSYTETLVNDLLKKWHTFSDWPLLRRELYERGYFDRNLSGSEYRRLK